LINYSLEQAIVQVVPNKGLIFFKHPMLSYSRMLYTRLYSSHN